MTQSNAVYTNDFYPLTPAESAIILDDIEARFKPFCLWYDITVNPFTFQAAIEFVVDDADVDELAAVHDEAGLDIEHLDVVRRNDDGTVSEWRSFIIVSVGPRYEAELIA